MYKKDLVPATLAGGPETPYAEEKPKHPKNPAVGTKTVRFANRVYIDQADVASFAPDEEITLMGWGNAIVRGTDRRGDVITAARLELHLEGDFKTTDKKITWLAADEGTQPVEAELWEFGHMITKDTLDKDDELDDFLAPETAWMTEALCDPNLAQLKEGDFLQLERKGYFRVDKAAGQGPHGRAVLFKIPTGAKE
ncbi:hypothetical protein VTK73DRAFT_6201 [Phialemonium thermophilum]|uniref:Glutamyl/glutaminyl-tRNA synthetase class Ib anti-codon binding domain-containing protein n=1 Tax=Phialemonium thermophilum TaxID=223376 RepID=A0ABR3UZV8_9PEZI